MKRLGILKVKFRQKIPQVFSLFNANFTDDEGMRTLSLLTAMFVVICHSDAAPAEDWQSLFNGKDLTGWKANVYPDSFKVVDGTIRAQATKESSHLFYVGDLKEGFVRFTNFELELMAR